MIKFAKIAIFLLLITPTHAHATGAENQTLGVGLNIGEPMGVNTRFYFIRHLAADVTVGYGFGEEALIIQPSILFNFRDILDDEGSNYSIVPYAGLGFKTGIDLKGRNDGEAVATLRFPVGVSLVLQDGRFELSAEVGPGVELNPETEFDITGGLELRYYFF